MLRERLRDDSTRRLIALGLAGALIRVLLMPFTLHFDAYQIYSRAAEAAYHNQWFGFTSQFLIQELHNVWLLIIRPFLPDSTGIWSSTASTIGVGASQADYERFLAYDHLYRLLFLMKMPYVVADLACAWVLTRLVEPARRVGVAAFWLFNPLVIFSSAIYGRHDAIAILLVLLSLLVVRRESDLRRVVALGLLGVATLTRFFPVILIPLFLLAYRRTVRQLALFLALLVGMAATVEGVGLLTSGKSTILTILNSYEHFHYWFDAGLYLRFDDWIFLFPVVYTLFLLWIIERGIAPREYPVFGAVAFLGLFSLTFFHPHYAIWLVPFLALTIPPSRKLITYHAIQVLCILVYSAQWGAWTTWNLFEPILGARVASLPDPVEFIAAQIEPRLFFGLFRSILTAVSLWMAWLLVRGMPSTPRRVSVSKAAQVLVMLLLLPFTSACNARVTGYQNPLAHDYAAVQWQTLDGEVEQAFIAGPGYSAAFANDPKTTPAQLQARWSALPADVRTGTLQSLQVGLRSPSRFGPDAASGARLQVRYDPTYDLSFPERDFHVWDDSTVWLPESDERRQVSVQFVSQYAMLAGFTIRVATFGGDVSAGDAAIGDAPTDALTLPVDGTVVATLPAGTVVKIRSAIEGWGEIEMPGGGVAFVPLDALASYPAPPHPVTEVLSFQVLDASGAVLRAIDVPPQAIHDNSHLTISFPPLEDTLDRKFIVSVSIPPGVTVRATKTDTWAGTTIPGFEGDLVFRPVWGEQPLLVDVPVDALPRDGDWVRVEPLPAVESGREIAVRIVPGTAPLEYGITPNRIPYGGWEATTANGEDLAGGLLVQTRYERDVDMGGILRSAASHLRGGVRADGLFTGVWLLLLAGMLFSVRQLRSSRTSRGQSDGR